MSALDPHFASLSRRQSMLLLTALAFGGPASVGAFDHLAEDEADLLRHRAQEILRIPREKRVPLLVQELRRRVAVRRPPAGADAPEELARVLHRERPALVEVVL